METIPKMAEEFRSLTSLDTQAKHEIAERFLEGNASNL